jgi:hypothetical protein
MKQLFVPILLSLSLLSARQQSPDFVFIEHIGESGKGIESVVISTQQVTKPHAESFIVSEASFYRIKRIVTENKSFEMFDPIEYGSFRFSVMRERNILTRYSIGRERSAEVFRQLIAFTEKQVYAKLTKKLQSIRKRIGP